MNDETKQLVSEKIEETIKAAEETVRHPYIKNLARFYTKGFIFIVIGTLALLVAFERKGGELADTTGALTTIAEKPYGRILLIIFILGAVSHGGWNILRGVADVDGAGGGVPGIFKRCLAVGLGIFYLGLAWTAWSLIIAERIVDRSGEMPRTLAGILLALPLGTLLVLIIGLGIIGGGVHEGYSGMTGKYQENFRLFPLGRRQRRIVGILGVLSFTARALIMGLTGYFFVRAAIDYNANEAAGLDRALATLAQSSYGKVILFVTAVGLVCHGALALYEARFRRIC